MWRRLAGLTIATQCLLGMPGPVAAQHVPYPVEARLLAGPPGTIISTTPVDQVPPDTTAYRILYRSTGLKGEPIAVSALVIVPFLAEPIRDKPVVAWAHPTSGVAPACAPSHGALHFQLIEGLKDLVARGYVVVATDYPGLGTAGPHPFLVGESEARAVLDSVRATAALPQAGAGTRFAVWGHSQGGHAALFTGLLVKDYAPDLELVGIAAAAPATELATLLEDDIHTTGGRNLTAMALWSWAQVFNAPMGDVVDAGAVPTVDRLAKECLDSIAGLVARHFTERPLVRDFLSVDNIATIEPWHSLLAQNTPGALPSQIPVFLAQGEADELVRPDVTRTYMQTLCRGGSAVAMLSMPKTGHAWAARDSASAAANWMASRFAGATPPSDCPGR